MSLQSFNSSTAGRAPASTVLIKELNRSWAVEKQSSRKEQNAVNSTNTFTYYFLFSSSCADSLLTEQEHSIATHYRRSEVTCSSLTAYWLTNPHQACRSGWYNQWTSNQEQRPLLYQEGGTDSGLFVLHIHTLLVWWLPWADSSSYLLQLDMAKLGIIYSCILYVWDAREFWFTHGAFWAMQVLVSL